MISIRGKGETEPRVQYRQALCPRLLPRERGTRAGVQAGTGAPGHTRLASLLSRAG